MLSISTNFVPSPPSGMSGMYAKRLASRGWLAPLRGGCPKGMPTWGGGSILESLRHVSRSGFSGASMYHIITLSHHAPPLFLFPWLWRSGSSEFFPHWRFFRLPLKNLPPYRPATTSRTKYCLCSNWLILTGGKHDNLLPRRSCPFAYLTAENVTFCNWL